jgi:hypothetical protein
MARLRSILLIAAGAALIAASLAWDLLRGAPEFGFGRKQLAGCLAGAVSIAIGIWLGRAGRGRMTFPYRSLQWAGPMLRWAAVLALTAVATLLALWLSREDLYDKAAWLFWCYFAALCLLLPLRLGALMFLAVGLLSVLLAAVNTIKVGATGLPLTLLDIRIALANPAGLWDALKLPAWSRYVATAGIVLAVSYLLYETGAATRRVLRSGEPRWLALKLARRVLGVAAIGLLATVYFQRLFHELGSYDEAWDTAGVAAMAQEIGVLPYLAYSQQMESSRTGDFFRASIGTEAPPAGEVREAIQRHIDFDSAPGAGARALPNIVILLAESTFDPNTAFRLDGKVSSSLFDPGTDTVAAGPFHVNVVGGGTWVTEFETIVGLDSRLFGYAGYYTHSSLSPYVSRSLFTHLEAKGYHTSVFFPHEGVFYNYRNAYQAYGADRIYDTVDQGMPQGWTAPDTRLVDAFKRIMGPHPAAPFLSYVLLTENHGPHECKVTDVSQITVHFADTAAFAPNCALHEYLRRLASTERAVSSLVDYLRAIEARDGRPYVLLVFGDHQPFTFTSPDWVPYDFAPLRTTAGMNQTFYHLISSAPGRVKCCLREIPATLVPTLLSAYAADDPDDIYLGVNLWLYERCGTDAIAGGPLTGLFRDEAINASSGTRARTDRRSESCRSAYESALAAYRDLEIITSLDR